MKIIIGILIYFIILFFYSIFLQGCKMNMSNEDKEKEDILEMEWLSTLRKDNAREEKVNEI